MKDIVDELKEWIEVKDYLRGHRTGELLRRAVEEIENLRKEVYHTQPGDLEYGSEGWTYKQAYHYLSDWIKQAPKIE